MAKPKQERECYQNRYYAQYRVNISSPEETLVSLLNEYKSHGLIEAAIVFNLRDVTQDDICGTIFSQMIEKGYRTSNYLRLPNSLLARIELKTSYLPGDNKLIFK